MRLSRILQLFSFTYYASAVMSQTDPVVTTKQGKLRGSVQNLLNGGTYYSFKGIPFAQPPVGNLRFQAPLPPKSWTGIRDAIEHGPVCPQYDMTTKEIIEGNEDCLFLNVYTKSLQPNAKIPVMVNIHGGGFMSGSGNTDGFGPEFFLQQNVILVTLNYRLEVLGFISLDIPEVPGNAAMKDQVAALRWVKQNIAKFGGDPDNVTILGESSGAAAVTFHLVSPMSKGLFHRAIVQSGVCIDDWGIADDPKGRAFKVGKILGKETDDPRPLLDFLRSVSAVKLTNMTFNTRTEDELYRGLPEYFVPVVEKKFDNVEAFLTENPIDLLKSGRINKVPLIIGHTSAEGLLLLKDQLEKKEVMNAQPSNYVPRVIFKRIPKEKLTEFGSRIKKFYFGDKDISNDTAEQIVNLQTDIHFAYNTHRFAYFYSTHSPVYMYRFEYVTDLNAVKIDLGLLDMKGASHADDLFYLYYTDFNKAAYNKEEKLRKIVFGLTKLLADFAATGNPTPNKTTPDVKWTSYNKNTRDFMILDENMRVEHYSERKRIEFWNSLYCEAGIPCMESVKKF